MTNASATMAVTVAVVDSGVNVPHPHLPWVEGVVTIAADGTEVPGGVDRLGHGTAVASAIHEKAPGAQLYAVKVFDDALATSVRTLVRAINWASERGIRLLNLSLGTPNDFRAAELEPAVSRAVECGMVIVAAFQHDGRLWYPGCMDGVIGVVLDWDHPRETVSVRQMAGRWVVAASGYPRPIPGVPPARNLNGISFAVANATGCLAAALANSLEARTAEEVLAVLTAPG